MVVVNPVIIVKGRRPVLVNQAESADILAGRAAYDHLGNVIEGSMAAVVPAGMAMAASAAPTPAK